MIPSTCFFDIVALGSSFSANLLASAAKYCSTLDGRGIVIMVEAEEDGLSSSSSSVVCLLVCAMKEGNSRKM